MKKIIVELGKCTGCKSCQIICALKNESEPNYDFARIKVSKDDSMGLSVPIPCTQCLDAPCVEACPVEAIVLDPKTGAKVIDDEECILCEACVAACPFGAISVIVKGGQTKVIKCDLCRGEPECVKHCEPGAILFKEASELAEAKTDALGDKLIEVIKINKGFSERT
jgi:Fe-S-cluster-containing hydrogenase component 2